MMISKRNERVGFLGWLLFPSSRQVSAGVSFESAASRSKAIVYGNVLVLAALAILTPKDIVSGTGVAIVLGTAASTFAAHALADQIEHSLLAAREPTHNRKKMLTEWKEDVRDSVPIASSAVLPALFLIAGWAGLISPIVAHMLAIGGVVVRFLLMGSMIGYLSGERRSRTRSFWAGIVLAIVAVLVALLKVVLTH